MRDANGQASYHEGLPADVRHWRDTDALRALLLYGGDAVGNVLLGDLARDRFVNASAPVPTATHHYPRLAAEALTAGHTWSSAGGEQPKFCTWSNRGHVLVKFSVAEDNPIAARWRDLLLAEHLALQTLAAAGVSTAASRVVDVGAQRFLELDRFDRVGALGTLIGNTDMHAGNLSFVSDQGRPYALSPAYDMLPMAFSPTAGGVVIDTVLSAHLHPAVDGATWRAAHALAQTNLAWLQREPRFSAAFQPCMEALHAHLADAAQKIGRLA